MKNLLVTGGCGFIGSNFIRYLFKDANFKGRIINVDKLTYAGNPENLEGFEKESSRHWLFPLLFRYRIRPRSIEIYHKLADAEALLEAMRNDSGETLSLAELNAAIDAPG